ncbi:MAG: hypothetical protein MI757_02395, partial [Pirellulales bacterium]|nr:hypothetical protein [Pirellulales bacterium]
MTSTVETTSAAASTATETKGAENASPNMNRLAAIAGGQNVESVVHESVAKEKHTLEISDFNL